MGAKLLYSGFETWFAPSTWNVTVTVTVGCWDANHISNLTRFLAPFWKKGAVDHMLYI